MNRKTNIVFVLCSMILSFCVVSSAFAVDNSYYSDEKGEEQFYNAKILWLNSFSESGLTYDVSEDEKVVILSAHGIANYSKAAFYKSGNFISDNADKFGTNSALVTCNEAKIKLTSCTIETNGKKAHALFAYHNSTINIDETTVTTRNNDSYNAVSSDGGKFVALNSNFIAENKSGIFAIFGNGEITVRNSSIKVNNNSIFVVKGSTAVISSAGNTFSYGEDEKIGTLLDITTTKKGEDVILFTEAELSKGNIYGSKDTSFIMHIKNKASFTGSINSNKKMAKASLKIFSGTRWILTGDSYLTAFMNEEKDNKNVYANGHKLFVNGEEISINQTEPSEEWATKEEKKEEPIEEPKEDEEKAKLYKMLKIFGPAFIAMLFITIILAKIYGRKKQKSIEKKTLEKASKNKMKKPWEK